MSIRDQYLEYFRKRNKLKPMTNSQSRLLDALLEPMVFEKISHVGDTKLIMDSVYEFAKSGEYEEEKGVTNES